MTREKALRIAYIKRKDVAREEREFLNVVIKALEQESVLDKIKTEVINLTDGETPERIWNVDVLQIIDKYKAESEGSNASGD